MNRMKTNSPSDVGSLGVDQLQSLFEIVSHNNVTTMQSIQECISGYGLSLHDYRLQSMRAKLEVYKDRPIDKEAFTEIVRDELLAVNKIFHHQLIIPDWQEFCQAIRKIYDEVAPNRTGENANYIPILRDANPEKWGVALCTVDGQRYSIGDVDVYHTIQSVSKPLTYAYAVNKEGEKFIHQFVGTEPSGMPFNDLRLMPDQRPFNPSVNAGALMVAGLVASGSPDRSARELTQDIMNFWFSLSGEQEAVRFSEETMKSELATAHNNYAIAYLLRGRKGLPRDVDLQKMIDLYLSCCSIEMTASMLSVAAATLAHGGICPITGKQVLPTEIVKKTLAVMQLSGMYDNAGTFLFEVGLPAKSGIAGAVMVVVPNVFGFATFSPRLDAYGNSVRGVAFCHKLVDQFTFHMYDSLSGSRNGCKLDPRQSQHHRKQRDLSDIRWALSYGDRYATKIYDLALTCMIDLCLADGDIEDSEIAVIAKALEEIVGSKVEPAQLIEIAQARQKKMSSETESPFDCLLKNLSAAQESLDDNARGIIFESAFRVACADGEIESEEYDDLLKIAQALGVHAGVVDLEIDRFKRRHLQH